VKCEKREKCHYVESTTPDSVYAKVAPIQGNNGSYPQVNSYAHDSCVRMIHGKVMLDSIKQSKAILISIFGQKRSITISISLYFTQNCLELIWVKVVGVQGECLLGGDMRHPCRKAVDCL